MWMKRWSNSTRVGCGDSRFAAARYSDRTRPRRPGELTRDAQVVTRIRPLADASHANRIPTGHPPEVNQERPRRPDSEAMVALHQAA